MGFTLSDALIAEENEKRLPALTEDYEHLGRRLARRGVDIERLTERAAPSGWPSPPGGWARAAPASRASPVPRSPVTSSRSSRTARSVQKLVRTTPAISLHIPWDRPDRPAELKAFAEARGLHIDSMNSNTFQDPPESRLSYKFGSLSHTDPAVRRQAVEHNLECLELGQKLGARSHTVWIGGRGELPRPAALPPRPRPVPGEPARDLPRPARGLAALHRAQALRARVLLDRAQRLGRELLLRARARGQGPLARGPRPPCAEREHRDDRGPPHPVRKARGLPLQRQQVRGRRPGRGLHQALPALPRSSTSSWTRSSKAPPASTPRTCSTSRTT